MALLKAEQNFLIIFKLNQMSYLNKNEQIRIESVKQLEQVYEVFKEEWDKDYSVDEEIDTFNGNELIKYVYWYNGTVALFEQKYYFDTITFDEFMSRVNPKPETTIIESTDGKKYEVIMIREVVEPLRFHEWFRKVSPNVNFAHADCYTQSKTVEEYIQYRKSLEL
jgi:hypothetical protein